MMEPRRTWSTARALLSLLACAGGLLPGARADPTCYDIRGNEDANQQPCYGPDATDLSATTWCCNKSDFCLSNGLCLSPASNNLMTQQGCTDKDWGEGCQQFCPAPSDTNLPANNVPLVPCPGSAASNAANFKFCCGPDAASCCSSSLGQSIPQGTVIRVPADLPLRTTSSSSDSSAATLRLGLGIGLGLGLPILLALVTICYLLFQRRGPINFRTRDSNNHDENDDRRSEDLDEKNPAGIHGRRGRRRGRRRETPSRQTAARGRRDSFGRVDTTVGPPSDDGNWPPTDPNAAWPPAGLAGLGGAGGAGGGPGGTAAAAIAAWARAHAGAAAGAFAPDPNAPFANGETITMDPPPSPKEIDGRSQSRSMLARNGGVAELPDGEVHDMMMLRANGPEVPLPGPGGWGKGDEVELPALDSDLDVERGGVKGEKR